MFEHKSTRHWKLHQVTNEARKNDFQNFIISFHLRFWNSLVFALLFVRLFAVFKFYSIACARKLWKTVIATFLPKSFFFFSHKFKRIRKKIIFNDFCGNFFVPSPPHFEDNIRHISFTLLRQFWSWRSVLKTHLYCSCRLYFDIKGFSFNIATVFFQSPNVHYKSELLTRFYLKWWCRRFICCCDK